MCMWAAGAVDMGVHPGRNPGRVEPGRARPPDFVRARSKAKREAFEFYDASASFPHIILSHVTTWVLILFSLCSKISPLTKNTLRRNKYKMNPATRPLLSAFASNFFVRCVTMKTMAGLLGVATMQHAEDNNGIMILSSWIDDHSDNWSGKRGGDIGGDPTVKNSWSAR